MSINKNTLRRLENQLSKRTVAGFITFEVPYSQWKDPNRASEIEEELIKEYSLENTTSLLVFVVNFAT